MLEGCKAWLAEVTLRTLERAVQPRQERQRGVWPVSYRVRRVAASANYVEAASAHYVVVIVVGVVLVVVVVVAIVVVRVELRARLVMVRVVGSR